MTEKLQSTPLRRTPLYQINENIFAIRDKGKYDWLNIETNKKIKPVAKSIFSQTKKNYLAKDSLYFDLLLDKIIIFWQVLFDQIKSWGR
ncbi:MAG: hypothetical protein IPN79_06215 [Saprospiraceae bacterium]|nr:hypothetical protein [Saprospiraceae bacterium]